MAVEFALLAGPLVAVLVALFEIGSNVLLLQQVERAGQRAAHALRSGAVVAGQHSAQSFRSAVMCRDVVLISCDDLVLHLSGPRPDERIVSADVSGARWCPGRAHDVRLLQVAYPMPLMSRIWTGGLTGTRHFIVGYGLRNAPDAPAGAC